MFSRSFVYMCVFLKYVYVFVVEYLHDAYCNSAANKDFDSDSEMYSMMYNKHNCNIVLRINLTVTKQQCFNFEFCQSRDRILKGYPLGV